VEEKAKKEPETISKQKKKMKTGTPQIVVDCNIGDKVKANFKGIRKKYTREIILVHKKTYSVQFDDGDFDKAIQGKID